MVGEDVRDETCMVVYVKIRMHRRSNMGKGDGFEGEGGRVCGVDEGA